MTDDHSQRAPFGSDELEVYGAKLRGLRVGLLFVSVEWPKHMALEVDGKMESFRGVAVRFIARPSILCGHFEAIGCALRFADELMVVCPEEVLVLTSVGNGRPPIEIMEWAQRCWLMRRYEPFRPSPDPTIPNIASEVFG